MNLMTSDAYPVYEEAIRDAYATAVSPPRTGKPGRPRGARQVLPEGLNYATVHKTRRKGPVGKVEMQVLFGTELAGVAAPAGALGGTWANTVFGAGETAPSRNRHSPGR